jgi:hypothetical protein
VYVMSCVLWCKFNGIALGYKVKRLLFYERL